MNEETIRERLMMILLRDALPWLIKVEMSPSTNKKLRDLINSIEKVTK